MDLYTKSKSRSRWTEEEDEILKQHYPNEGEHVSKRLPGRCVSCCMHRATRYLGLQSLRKSQDHNWTEEDYDILRHRYPREGASQEIADLIGVSRIAAGAMARTKLGLRWQPMSKKELLEHRRIKARRKYANPDYRKRIQEKEKSRRMAYSNAGLCRCGRERFYDSAQCKLHWAVSVGSTAGNSSNKFASKILIILEKQDYKCMLTGKTLIPGDNASLDHIIPKVKGGINNVENLQWVTLQANRAKGVMLLQEFLIFCKRVIAHHEEN